MNATIPAGYDFNLTCQQAEIRCLANGRIEYGIPGLDICGYVEKNAPASEYYPLWNYGVICRALGRQLQDGKDDRETALLKMLLWLREVRCPGNLAECFPDQLARRASGREGGDYPPGSRFSRM